MNLNRAQIIGNLTRDPEVKTTPSNLTVASFAVATSLTWTDNNNQKHEKVEFHNIVAWRKLAEICGQYLHKGSKVFVEGRLETRNWTGQDGIKRYRTEIIADNLIMLSPAKQREQAPEPMPQEESGDDSYQDAQYQNAYPDDEIRVENIPF